MINFSSKTKYKKGATLLEMMVVVGIFVVISGVTVFNYGQFNSSMSTQNLVDDIALSIRKAQSYAIGVRGINDTFIGGYGVRFSVNPLTSGNVHQGTNKSFVVFAEMETTPNRRYDYGAYNGCGNPVLHDECLEILKILSADEISNIRIFGAGDSLLATLVGDDVLDILFYRPNPEPSFCYRKNPIDINCSEDQKNIVYVKIEVKNMGGGVETIRSIRISNSGQISVSE